MDEKQLQALYNSLSSHLDIGDYNSFKAKMQTPDDRKNFYNAVSKEGFDIGDYDSFEKRIGGEKKNSGNNGSPLSNVGTMAGDMGSETHSTGSQKDYNLKPVHQNISESTVPQNHQTDFQIQHQVEVNRAQQTGSFASINNLKSEGIDTDNLNSQQVRQLNPQNLPQRIALDKVAKLKTYQEHPFADASLINANPQLADANNKDYQTPFQFRDKNNAKAGSDILHALNDPDVIEMAQQDPKMAQQYKDAQANLYQDYPKLAMGQIATKISQYREHKGENSYILNNVSEKNIDKYVDEMSKLPANDQYHMTPSEITAYKQTVLPALKSHEAEIKTTGFLESLGEGTKSGINDIGKTLRNTLNTVTFGLPQKAGLIESDSDRQKRLVNDQYTMSTVTPEHAGTVLSSGLGNFSGYMIPMIATGSVLKGLGLSEIPANRLSNYLMFEGNNSEKALQDHPDNKLAQVLQTGITTLGDIYLMEKLPANKISTDIRNSFRNEVKDVAENLATNNITTAEAKTTLLNKFGNVLKKTAQGNIEAANIMTADNAFHQGVNSLLGTGNKSEQDALNEDLQTWKTAFLGSTILSGVHALSNTSPKIQGNILREIAENPEKYKPIIENSNAAPEAKADLLQNLNDAVNISNDLRGKEDLTQPQRDKLLITELQKRIAQRQLVSTSTEALQKEPLEKIDEANKTQQNILSGKDNAPEHQTVSDKEVQGIELISRKSLIDEATKSADDITGVYKSVFLDNPEQVMKEAAEQLNSSPDEARVARVTFGEKISDIALKLFPNAKAENTNPKTDIENQQGNISTEEKKPTEQSVSQNVQGTNESGFTEKQLFNRKRVAEGNQRNDKVDLSGYAPTLYKEISANDLEDFLPNGGRSGYMKDEQHFADSKNLSKGQGEGKGIVLTFDSDGIKGTVNLSKPGLQFTFPEQEGEYYTKNAPLQQREIKNNLKEIEIKPDAKFSKIEGERIKARLNELEQKGWGKETKEDGTIVYSRDKKVSEKVQQPEKSNFDHFKEQMLSELESRSKDKFDLKINHELLPVEQKTIEQGIKNIREGKDTKAAQQVEAAIKKMYDDGIVHYEAKSGKIHTQQPQGIPASHFIDISKEASKPIDINNDDHLHELNMMLGEDAFPHVVNEENANFKNQTDESASKNDTSEGTIQQPTKGQAAESNSKVTGNEGGTPPQQPVTAALTTEGEPSKTGIKNTVSENIRQTFDLPKVQLPKLGNDAARLIEGKRLVDSGEINPSEVIDRIIKGEGKIGMQPDEAKAMQYYMHQLNVHDADLVDKKANAETPEQELELNSQRQQLSDLMDAATEANMLSGTAWSDTGLTRQIVVDDGFNPSREKQLIKDAYNGEVPKEVQQKLDDAIKERDEAIAKAKKLEEDLKQKEASRSVDEMKKTKPKGDYKEKRKSLLEDLKAAKEEHEKWLNDNGIQKSGVGFTLTGKMVKIIGDYAKTYVDEGIQKLEEIINKVFEDVKGFLPEIEKKQIRDAIALHETSKLETKANTLEGKLASGDIAPNVNKLKSKFQKNNDWVKANQRVINAQYKIRQIKNNAFNSQKNMYQKGLMWVNRLVRASVLSGYNVLYKLASAAVVGGAIKRLPEQMSTHIWATAYKGVAEKAPIEGFVNAKSEAKFYKEFFNPKKFAQNTFSILKDGESNLTKKFDSRTKDDLAEITMPGKQTSTGKKVAKAILQGFDRITSFPTDLHMVIKDPLKRATYEASLNNGLVWAEKNGLDITHPLVINSFENAAYKRANYEIFQEDNKLTKKFNEWKSQLEKSKNPLANTAKALVDFMLPVSTVPTNIARRIITTSPVGLIRGNVQVIEAYRKGLENLSNEQADKIMRQLKQGTFGTALWLAGWYGYASFGGLYSKYDPNKKRKEGEFMSDEMEVGGEMIPKPVQHALPLEILQFAATARHIYENYKENKDASTPEALFQAGLGSIGALTQQIPIISTGSLMAQAFTDPYYGDKLKDDMKRRFEPQILRETGVIGTKDSKLKTLQNKYADSKSLFKNEIKAYDEDGTARPISVSEFREYKQKRDDKIKEDIQKLYTEGKPVVEDGQVTNKPFDKLTDNEIREEISVIKSNATAQIKKEMFGEKKTDYNEIQSIKDARQKLYNQK